MLGENCRSGCPERNHESYAACLKDTTFHAALGESHDANVRGEAELSAYRAARAQGIQPASTRKRDIDRAVILSDKSGSAFNAGE